MRVFFFGLYHGLLLALVAVFFWRYHYAELRGGYSYRIYREGPTRRPIGSNTGNYSRGGGLATSFRVSTRALALGLRLSGGRSSIFYVVWVGGLTSKLEPYFLFRIFRELLSRFRNSLVYLVSSGSRVAGYFACSLLYLCRLIVRFLGA